MRATDVVSQDTRRGEHRKDTLDVDLGKLPKPGLARPIPFTPRTLGVTPAHRGVPAVSPSAYARGMHATLALDQREW